MRPLVSPNLNTGHSWPEMDIEDLEMGIREAWPINEVAHYLRRTEKEVQGKARELFGRELPPRMIGLQRRPQPEPFDRDDLVRLIQRRQVN